MVWSTKIQQQVSSIYPSSKDTFFFLFYSLFFYLSLHACPFKIVMSGLCQKCRWWELKIPCSRADFQTGNTIHLTSWTCRDRLPRISRFIRHVWARCGKFISGWPGWKRTPGCFIKLPFSLLILQLSLTWKETVSLIPTEVYSSPQPFWHQLCLNVDCLKLQDLPGETFWLSNMQLQI